MKSIKTIILSDKDKHAITRTIGILHAMKETGADHFISIPAESFSNFDLDKFEAVAFTQEDNSEFNDINIIDSMYIEEMCADLESMFNIICGI